jgi:hypothetical protein
MEEDVVTTFMLKSRAWSRRIGAKVVELSSNVEKLAVAGPAKTNLIPKETPNVTQSKHYGAGEPIVANRAGPMGNCSGQVEEHRVSREPVSPIPVRVVDLGDIGNLVFSAS